MKTVDLSYFIERYNAGEMNEAEKAWFRKELIKNEKLRDEIALRQKAEMVIKNREIIQLRNKLSAIDKKRIEAINVKSNRKHLHLTRAAVIAGIILAGSLVFLSTRKMDSGEVFDRFYKSYEPTTPVRSAEITTNVNYSNAIQYYNVRDYRNAANLFSKVPESSDPISMESVMLYGVCRFEERNYVDASHTFTRLIVDNSNYFVEDAQWYLAWCYLKTGEMEKASEQFNFIKNSGNIYSKTARKILRKVKMK